MHLHLYIFNLYDLCVYIYVYIFVWLVRGAAHGPGIRNLLDDLGVTRRLICKTDASVAKSIASRRGAEKTVGAEEKA